MKHLPKKHRDRIKWMFDYAARHDVELDLESEVGFGRPCVGILVDGLFPDYHWYDDEYERIDENDDVWAPDRAYHKHPCVAVLGTGKEAEKQLFEWLKWFDDNGFVVERGDVPGVRDPIKRFLGQHKYARMVRKNK